MALVLTWIGNSLAIYAVAYLMRSVEVASLLNAFVAGGVLTLINAVVKPILVILTLPLTIVTLGLFYFFVTAFCLWLASYLVPGFMRPRRVVHDRRRRARQPHQRGADQRPHEGVQVDPRSPCGSRSPFSCSSGCSP